VLRRDIADKFLDNDRLADARPAEQPHLAALRVGRHQIDHLDPRLEDFLHGHLLLEARRRPVDRHSRHVRRQRWAAVDRFPDHVEDAAERRLAHGHRDRAARIHHLIAAHQAVGRVECDRAHRIIPQVLLHLADNVAARPAFHLERRSDLG